MEIDLRGAGRFLRSASDECSQALARICRRRHRVVCGARLDRRPHLPAGPADSRRSSRPTARDSSDLERFTPGRTSGSRWAAWRSARSGATAATSRPTGPPTGCTARRCSSSNAWAGCRPALRGARAGTAGRARRAGLQQLLRAQHLRCPHRPRSRSSPIRAQAFDANLAYYTDVFRERPRGVRDPAGALTDPKQLRQLTAFFFWTLVGRVDESARRRRHLHEQLAARAAGRQPARPATRSSGRASASSCCSPASARWRSWHASQQAEDRRRDIPGRRSAARLACRRRRSARS